MSDGSNGRLNSGLEVLDRAGCLRLLTTESVGRLAFLGRDHRIEVFPVNYVVDDDRIVFRSDLGTKLTALDAPSVAFEVDHLDAEARSGWSVVARGPLSRTGEPRFAALLANAGWVRSTKPYVLRMALSEITGRRIDVGRSPGL